MPCDALASYMPSIGERIVALALHAAGRLATADAKGTMDLGPRLDAMKESTADGRENRTSDPAVALADYFIGFGGEKNFDVSNSSTRYLDARRRGGVPSTIPTSPLGPDGLPVGELLVVTVLGRAPRPRLGDATEAGVLVRAPVLDVAQTVRTTFVLDRETFTPTWELDVAEMRRREWASLAGQRLATCKRCGCDSAPPRWNRLPARIGFSRRFVRDGWHTVSATDESGMRSTAQAYVSESSKWAAVVIVAPDLP
jgi:hypothetical protein